VNVPARWADAHLHLDSYPDDEREAVLHEAFAEGIAAVVSVSMHFNSCIANRGIAESYPGRVHPAYGFHPEQPLPGGEEADRLFRWIRERYMEGERFAIGEVGLPYYSRTEAERRGERFDEAPYLALLDRFAALAAELDRPIVLHAVYEDADKALDILASHHVRRAHFHWFKGPQHTVSRMIEAGCFISVTPDVLYEQEIQRLVRQYPIELMMTETDGPWPFEGPFAGLRTKPAMVREVAKAIADLKGMPLEMAEAQLLRNVLAFYGIRFKG
jgi:TatD DNase family protein